MPARTRLLIRIASVVFILISVSVLGRWLNRDATQTYNLTNDSAALSNEIATNKDNTGLQLAKVELISVDGTTVSTDSFLGTPTIINIWYSTCEPCRRELPVLASAAEQYGDKVHFVGVNIKDSAKVAKDFATKYRVNFEIFLDLNGAFISSSGISTAPVTLAVNAQGLIIAQIAGELSTNKLTALVTELLG